MEPIKILLVDDDKDFVETISKRLRRRNLEADTAFDGEHAIEFVTNQIPDVMIVDLRMPEISGMEVLKMTIKTHPEIKIIILTAYGSIKDKMKALTMGAYAFLEKPVDINLLIRAIKDAYNDKPFVY